MSSDAERPRVAADVEKWIVEARQGDREALGRLLDVCRHYLLFVAGNELPPTLKAKVAPSDIVQDTLMAAGRAFPRFVGGSEQELLAWLRGILRNNVVYVHRQYTVEKRRVTREVPLDEVPLLELPLDPGESPSGHAKAHEQDEQLERALRQLPEHYRQVILLHSDEKLTFAEIAAKLGSTADAVRKMWGRAVVQFAKLLEPPHESA